MFRHKLYQLREERDMKPETFASLVSALLYEKRFLLYQTPGYLLLNMSNLLPGFIWGLHVFRCDFINDLFSSTDFLFKEIVILGIVVLHCPAHLI